MGHYSPKPSISKGGWGGFSLWMLRIDSTFTNYQNPQGFLFVIHSLDPYQDSRVTLQFLLLSQKTSFKAMTRILGRTDQALSSNNIVIVWKYLKCSYNTWSQYFLIHLNTTLQFAKHFYIISSQNYLIPGVILFSY